MTKFDKTKKYRIGKLKTNSDTTYDVELVKGYISVPGDKLIEISNSFEDWLESDAHKFKPGDNIALAEQTEDGKFKFVTEYTVPKIDYSIDPNEGLSDNSLDYFGSMERQSNSYITRKENERNSEIIEVLKEQIQKLEQENLKLKKEIAEFYKEKESGLSDNIMSKLELQNSQKMWEWEKNNLQKELNVLQEKINALSEENKGLSDNAQTQALKIMEYSQMLMNTPIGQGLQAFLMSKISGGQPQIQQQQQMQQQAPQQPQPTITDEELMGEV